MQANAADLFFYGSLRDVRLLEIVLARPVPATALMPATATGVAPRRLRGEAYPVLVDEPGAVADGVLLTGADEADLARLAFYEEAEYDLAAVTVETADGPVEAACFRGTGKTAATAEFWDFGRWCEHDLPAARFAAEELMDHYGRLPVEEIDTIWPGIMTRARQRARAQAAPAGPGPLGTAFGPADVEIEARTRPWTGFLGVETYRVRHRRFDGGWKGPLDRVAVIWGDAVTVLPWDPVRDRVVLIEQFRPGPLSRGDPRPWCIEVVAGRIDADAGAEATARKEAEEEAGVRLGRMARIGGYYATSGLAAEHLTAFVGEAELPETGDSLHGLATEGEDIRAIVLPFEDAMAAVAEDGVNTGPALVSLLWLAANRERLAADWRG